ncbi:hypothetical protein [Ottowia caeni]|uniref:hypothetical protein n=1 Tax=Ottowia caeni TaxID=2870339 RepID=UPI001E4F6208|nr:hypothetical protein [Ottowia caeni]
MSTLVFRGSVAASLLTAFLTGMLISTAQAGEASGTLVHQARSGPIEVKPKHAYLVVGPNFENKTVRLLVLSEADMTAAIKGCDRLGCVAGELMAGTTVEFDAGSRMGYWFVANGQRVQHSDTARPETMNLSQNTPQRLAGQWSLTGGVGPTGSVKFDATLVKTFSKP